MLSRLIVQSYATFFISSCKFLIISGMQEFFWLLYDCNSLSYPKEKTVFSFLRSSLISKQSSKRSKATKNMNFVTIFFWADCEVVVEQVQVKNKLKPVLLTLVDVYHYFQIFLSF